VEIERSERFRESPQVFWITKKTTTLKEYTAGMRARIRRLRDRVVTLRAYIDVILRPTGE
jgi:hypothetical protein